MAFWNRKKKAAKINNIENADDSNIKTDDTPADLQTDDIADGIIKETDLKEQGIFISANEKDRQRFVRECCESVMESDRQIDEAKKEYEIITSHLADIQKIDRISGDERKELADICKNIVNLVNERNRYKNRELTITEAQIRKFEPYEENLADEIKKMYGAETYQKAIESDIENLNQEKQLLYDEQYEIFEKQNSLKAMAKVLSWLVISLFALFIAVYYALEVDMTFPYLGTILLAAVSATVIFTESNKNRRDMVLNGRKVNKAIGLINRVKIKYVNNVNMMSYNREKYGVKDAKDFEDKWHEYCKMKEYERRFRENTKKLDFNSENLSDLLRQNNITDCDIWISQAMAIIDEREMVEIRHELNQGRQKMRERIEYNETVKAETVKQIDELIKQYPDQQEELLDIVKEYNTLEHA
ncbi:MAG TPA: hypothetical protein DCZ23_04240 [Lachnospiraceae bacterium]|nr:hypothetical protein [Lachnospiraceae bacterium]